MKKCFSFLIISIFAVVHLIAQNSSSVQTGIEIKAKRDRYSKTFLNPTGTYQAVLSTAPVHYKENGSWEEINTMIRSGQAGYQNESNVIRSYFPETISKVSKLKLLIEEFGEIFIHSDKKPFLLNEQNMLMPVESNFSNAIANVNQDIIRYDNIYQNVCDEYKILNGQIKNNIILKALPSFLDDVNNGYFGFQETIELPEGWKITSLDRSSVTITNSELLILDSEGKHVLSIPAPVFFDQYGLQSDGVNAVQGKYSVVYENGQWKITTLVPVAWLKNTNTKYPVSIDPTIVIAGTTGGWQSPNNYVDNPIVVFLGVCCSNLTHRAWNKFNTTAIPSTSCIIDVEYQANVTGQANATPELVLINDVTGAFGPYGAITPAAYNDFGTGFYTSFTIAGLGVYGYYSLGASANALLQTQLPLGWFQVAMQFNNEPSTNYKIISGTTSNLRVTYAAPPCLLPIELLSFDAKCNNEQVNISWETISQTENHHFELERTVDGINYEKIGTIAGAGNSSQSLKYTFTDPNPPKGTSYYSLKQFDNNGKEKDLSLVAVTCDELERITASPNPGTGIYAIDGVSPNSEVIVTDIIGQIIYRSVKDLESKSDLFQIDLSKELNGIYFIHVLSSKGMSSEKIILNR